MTAIRPECKSCVPQATQIGYGLTIARAAELMQRHQIRRLPIVDRGRNLVGVVSLGDLAVETKDERLSGGTLERVSEPG